MDKFIVNIIHRPEMVPEYAEKVTGHGKEEDISRKALLTESLDIFKFQQETAHKNGLKTTIQMTYASLFNDEAVEIAKADHEKYGDEIALSLLGLPCKEFRDKYKTKDFCIWMFSMEDKKSIVDDVFGKFKDRFGFYPESTGSYYMDADLINYIKEKYPTVKCAVATCWEEGPKAYHTCNNSWYTFMDGGPWAPWIPSKQNVHAPALNEKEDSGIVAIPHLSRDLLSCFDGNGSNFGTHPQNVLRGMIYDTKTWEYPYLYNLIDQYRSLEKYNNGYAYNMMFVGPGWLNKMGRWEQPYELLAKSYNDGMKYYGDLKKEGKLTDMTMAELADYYRDKKTYTEPECALWKDILYGSDKQLFWYCDPFMRTCINMDQCGAIVDLRPYAAKLEWPVGIGTKHVWDASYPYLIQEKYRAGYFTHYAGEGTVRSAKVTYNGEEVDLCLCRTHAKFAEEDLPAGDKDIKSVSNKEGNPPKRRILNLEPVELEFSDLTLTLETKVIFDEGTGVIRHERKITKISNPDAEVSINEYMVACYGTTEYSDDMSSVTLSLNGKNTETIQYAYKCRELSMEDATSVEAVIPPVETKVTFGCDKMCKDIETGCDKADESMAAGTSKGTDAVAIKTGYIKEGYAFSPMFTLGYTSKLKKGEVISSWLKLEKAN